MASKISGPALPNNNDYMKRYSTRSSEEISAKAESDRDNTTLANWERELD
jgi:hypothetical protein